MLKDVWFDIIAIVEKIESCYKPDIKDITRHQSSADIIPRLIDPTKTKKEDWFSYWKTPNLTKEFPFPNIVLDLLSYKAQFLEETKTSFGLALNSLMQIPWKGKDGLIGTTTFTVNDEKKWQHTALTRKIRLDKEPLIRLAIGSLIMWGLNLKEQNTILQSYFNLKALNTITTKIESFRTNVFQLMAIKNSFRQWVLDNKLDYNNDFKWDKDVPLLGLNLIPLRDSTNHKNNNNVPTELNAIDTYPPSVIETFLTWILENAERFGSGSIQELISQVEENMSKRDHFKSNSDLVNRMNERINQLKKLSIL